VLEDVTLLRQPLDALAKVPQLLTFDGRETVVAFSLVDRRLLSLDPPIG
jgi:hypothetical protein